MRDNDFVSVRKESSKAVWAEFVEQAVFFTDFVPGYDNLFWGEFDEVAIRSYFFQFKFLSWKRFLIFSLVDHLE